MYNSFQYYKINCLLNKNIFLYRNNYLYNSFQYYKINCLLNKNIFLYRNNYLYNNFQVKINNNSITFDDKVNFNINGDQNINNFNLQQYIDFKIEKKDIDISRKCIKQDIDVIKWIEQYINISKCNKQGNDFNNLLNPVLLEDDCQADIKKLEVIKKNTC